MDIVKCEGIKYSPKTFLIVGVEKSGKTSFIGTMPRPILVFAGETGAETRFAGQKDIDVVQCYDMRGEIEGAGVKRFDKNFKELMVMKTVPYKTIALDPLTFLSNAKIQDLKRLNPRDSRACFGQLLDYYSKLLLKLIGLEQYVVVTSHVSIEEDETTGAKGFLPSLQGSIRNYIGGWFDAVLFTKTQQVGVKTKFSLLALPDSQRKCGIRVPLGMEDKIGRECESDFGKIVELLTVKGES